MTAAKELKLVSVEDYLASELASDVKHEYLGGMTGGRTVHNRVAGALYASLHARLRGRPCEPFNSDMKVLVHRRTDNGFATEAYEGLDAVIPLEAIQAELPLAELYERVEFGADNSPRETDT